VVKPKHWRKWLYRRAVRLQGTPHAIARGMALGVILGCVIPPGIQIIVGIPIALLLSGNLITMMVGTLVSNPITYVPLYYFTCQVGAVFLRLCGVEAPLGDQIRGVIEQMVRLNASGVLEGMRSILECWTIGGLIVGLACCVPAYYGTYLFVIEVHKLRRFALQRRAARRRERGLEEPPAEAHPPGEPDEEAPDEQPPPPPE